MNAQCTQDEEVDLFMVALNKVQRVMAKLSSDHKFSGRYNTVTISGVVRRHVDGFHVSLTVHLSITLANDELDAPKYIYYTPLHVHVSSNVLLILRRSNFINTASGIVTVSK
jgi:hypothetical protein